MNYKHDTIKPFEEEDSKKNQITKMFNNIAFRYDFMNRFLSLGIDICWRKKAIKELKNGLHNNILDIATGTGDMAIMAVKILNPEKITGIDISKEMLKIAEDKIKNKNLDSIIKLKLTDSETINIDNDTFDSAMVAFGVRNFENLEKGLSEIYRVLSPNAKFVVLEFGRPRLKLISFLYDFYMNRFAPFIAGIFTKNKKAYQYLTKSYQAFPDRENFLEVLNKVGFENTIYKTLSLGICYIYCGTKKA